MTLSIPGVDLLPCAVVIECYVGPPCTALVSDRVRVLALKQPVCLSLPGRAERVTKGHKGPTGVLSGSDNTLISVSSGLSSCLSRSQVPVAPTRRILGKGFLVYLWIDSILVILVLVLI